MQEKRRIYQAALYMRLSRDDGAGESASIGTQRKILRAYAAEHGYEVCGEYVDDGYSGTNFDRPDWRRMIRDIEEKKIDMVITKDLSRLGRDYIAAGQYTEIYFPSKGVRYIAVNDGYDSESPYTDIAPFKNVINEMYARDTSKKIRSAFQAKMREGAFIGNFAPYGYQKDPENKNHLLIDPAAAPIVKKIFQMALEGEPPSAIAHTLNGGGVATPAQYRLSKCLYLPPGGECQYAGWTSSGICKMLRNKVYLGQIAQGKTTKVSFKSHLTLQNPPEEWITVAHMHEPLVSQETFDQVRRRSIARRNGPKTGFRNVFSGIARCADCGRNLSVTGNRSRGSAYLLVCGRYKLYGREACTNHFIDYGLLEEVVLRELRDLLALTDEEKDAVICASMQAQHTENPEADREKKALQKRVHELDRLVTKLYEDNISEKLDEIRFYQMLESCQAQQREITARLAVIARRERREPDTQEERIRLKTRLDALTRAEKLTPELLRSLVDSIEVCQGTYDAGHGRGHKHQTIKIHFKI